MSGATLDPSRAPNTLLADLFAVNNGGGEALRLRWNHTATPGLQFNFEFFGNNGSAGAFDSYRPSVVDLNAFASRPVGFRVPGTDGGGAIVSDIDVRATFQAAPSVTDPLGSLFAGYGVFDALTSQGAIAGWNVTGPGTATLQDLGDGTRAALLTTGSPVSLSQLIDTPADPFELLFDYEFLTTTGTLEVLLDGQLLATIGAPDSLVGAFAGAMLLVDDPMLLGQSGLDLTFRFDGVTESRILLDNVSAAAVVVPLPGALWLAAPVLAVLGVWRRAAGAG